MFAEIKHALESDRLIDITTIGRKTGKAHRIEIAFHYYDEVPSISGMPGPRDWYANLVANPDFTFHLKQSVKADLPAIATPILAEDVRRGILAKVVRKWGRENDLESFVARSPLVQVQLELTE